MTSSLDLKKQADEMLAAQGGYAFPHMMAQGHKDYAGGMTLRDWFAGNAMCRMLTVAAEAHVSMKSDIPKIIASKAYEMADAMLEARKR